MYKIDINLEEEIGELELSNEQRLQVMQYATTKLRDSVRDHIGSQKSKSFYQDAAAATDIAEVTETSATIIVARNHRGFALQLFGGTVKPTGRISEITKKPIKNLSIPNGKNKGPIIERKNGKPLAYVPLMKGGKLTGMLVPGINKQITRGKNKGKIRVQPIPGAIPEYWLVAYTEHKPHPDLLPTEDEMYEVAREALISGAERIGKI